MPDSVGTLNDGGVAFGSQVVVVGATSYIFEKIEIKRPVNRYVRRNEVNVPNGKFLTQDIIEGSATLQLPTATTAGPARFAAITLKPVGGGAGIDFHIEEVGDAFEQGGETKVNITFSQKLGT